MNKNANYIRNRLSLRAPQEESLNILAELYELMQPQKNKGVLSLSDMLDIVKGAYPTCKDFERNFQFTLLPQSARPELFNPVYTMVGTRGFASQSSSRSTLNF